MIDETLDRHIYNDGRTDVCAASHARIYRYIAYRRGSRYSVDGGGGRGAARPDVAVAPVGRPPLARRVAGALEWRRPSQAPSDIPPPQSPRGAGAQPRVEDEVASALPLGAYNRATAPARPRDHRLRIHPSPRQPHTPPAPGTPLQRDDSSASAPPRGSTPPNTTVQYRTRTLHRSVDQQNHRDAFTRVAAQR